MSKNKSKKYAAIVIDTDDGWVAQIVRQVTSRKTVVTKKKSGFDSREKAQDWGDKELTEFKKILSSSNQRHTQQRKSQTETRRQRSARRADKTAEAKQAAADKGSADGSEHDDETQVNDD